MSIPTEAIEAGARAMDTRALPRDNAIAALTAAAPAIQAAALRDEADKMDRRAEQFDTINDNPKDHEYETLVRYGAYAGEARSSAYRLRARADQLEGETT